VREYKAEELRKKEVDPASVAATPPRRHERRRGKPLTISNRSMLTISNGRCRKRSSLPRLLQRCRRDWPALPPSIDHVGMEPVSFGKPSERLHDVFMKFRYDAPAKLR